MLTIREYSGLLGILGIDRDNANRYDTLSLLSDVSLKFMLAPDCQALT